MLKSVLEEIQDFHKKQLRNFCWQLQLTNLLLFSLLKFYKKSLSLRESMHEKASFKISCFGAGFVGIPTSSVLALYNPHLQFIVYDISTSRIEQCKLNKPPIYQPGLEDIMVKTNHVNLSFTDQLSEALDGVSIIFLALPTPTKNFGEKKGKAYDLSYTEDAIRTLVKYYNENKIEDHVILVEKSTVPIGTAKMITKIIQAVSIKQNINKYIVTSNPEFLAQGSAISDLLKPDRIVIGSLQGQNIQKLVNLYSYVDKSKIILTNQYSSELSKLVANCFLAQRVSSINSIAIICQEYQADIKEVKKCISADTRIGDKFLNSSIGFGGSCFKKDILALIYLAEIKGLDQVANYWNAVIQMNQYRKKNFFLRIFKSLNFNLKNKILTIFGTAFKKDTNDPRQSPAVEICHYILQQGAEIHIYDPKTSLHHFIQEIKLHQLWKESYKDRIKQFEAPQEAVKGSHAILIATEWDIFKTYNYEDYYSMMQKPAHIFDGRNLLNEQQINKLGFNYHRVGKKFKSN